MGLLYYFKVLFIRVINTMGLRCIFFFRVINTIVFDSFTSSVIPQETIAEPRVKNRPPPPPKKKKKKKKKKQWVQKTERFFAKGLKREARNRQQ